MERTEGKGSRWRVVLLLVLLVSTCAGASRNIQLRPPLWNDRDDRSIPEPKERHVSELYAIVYNSWLRHLSAEHQAMAARRPPALNVNAWDEVPDSTWFNHRIGRRELTFEEMVGTLEGKAPEPGRWRIIRLKSEGYTPGFDIEDPSGRKYVLKLDLPGALERNSAAERICTLILHAAGYNVPHNSIVYFDSGALYADDRSYFSDAVGKRKPLTADVLRTELEKLEALPDGRYRGLASLFLPGKPVGRFVYVGRRKDDPNDLIPHELRRELRGLRIIASWINHVDVGDKNALDIYFTAPEGGQFVKHYLLDFGSTMGSGNFFNGPFRVGHEYLFDGKAIALSFITLGQWRRPWEEKGRILYPEVGYFQAEVFDPSQWKPNYPNLAFLRMDEGDAYWGAKIVTAFSDGLIRRLVEAGEYSRPEVSRHVEEVLKRRRHAIGLHWLDLVTPLEELTLEAGAGRYRLRFRDLAIERGFAERSSRRYRVWIEDLDGRKLAREEEAHFGGGALELPAFSLPPANSQPDRYGRTPAVRLMVRSNRRDGRWARPLEVGLGFASHSPEMQVLGWTRNTDR